MKNAIKLRFTDLPKDYEGLCRLLLPRPIHDGVDYANGSEMTDAMVLWQDGFTPAQRDYFDLLCALMEEFDKAHVKWPKVKGVEMLKHLLAEQEMNAADLSRLLGGSRNLGAMILRGDRNLTIDHVRTLAAHFKVSAALFL